MLLCLPGWQQDIRGHILQVTPASLPASDTLGTQTAPPVVDSTCHEVCGSPRLCQRHIPTSLRLA